MASGGFAGSGGILRRTESKVYTRKSHGKNPSGKKAAAAATQAPLSSHQTIVVTTNGDPCPSLQKKQKLQMAVPPPAAYHAGASDDEASSLNRPPSTDGRPRRRVVTLSVSDRSAQEVRELRRKLTAELDRVHLVIKRLEAHDNELQLAAGRGGGAPSQLSVNFGSTAGNVKRAPVVSEAASTTPDPIRRQLSVTVPPVIGTENSVGESMEKEKRSPKANQYNKNSEFILCKDKFPPPDSQSHKKSKAGGSKKHSSGKLDHGAPSSDKKMYADAFKSCSALLQKLMKHEFGWVFNKPVDAKALGLYDYFTIIKHPMDLGTVKSRLSKNWYATPKEFAADVRLTFRNAMTYNPKEQDVHKMAEHLAKLFDDRWPTLEAECANVLRPLPMVSSKKVSTSEKSKILERSDSTVRPVPLVVDSNPKPVIQTQYIGRSPALKKPKAKELNKRDMTFDEKQRLSRQLQSLPPEKLDNIVQIIKKRNSDVNQNDDEIEVDIDSMDAETLWELDRFVTNYRKSLSKHKRKAELAMQARTEAEHQSEERILEKNTNPGVAEVPMVNGRDNVQRLDGEKNVIASSQVVGEHNDDDHSGSSDSGSSSSDSGSSSSDSGSESSS